VTICQDMWTVNLASLEWSKVEVGGHTAPCQAEELPGQQAVQAILVEHLRQNGFDVSGLK
jgi:hypothetical protein